MGGDATSHPLTSENYYPNKIPNFFIDNEMSVWDFTMPVNQCSRLVHTFPNKLPDYLLATKEHGRCTDGHAVSA